MRKRLIPTSILLAFAASATFGAAFHNPYGKFPTNATAGDRMFADYFRNEAHALSEKCLADIRTLDDWKQCRPELRRQLFEMLSLDPLPPKTDLKAVVTGRLEQP